LCLAQDAREPRQSIINGFTSKGGIAVIANQLNVVARTLIAARKDLTSEINSDSGSYAHPSIYVVNGLLASATTGLQAVLDAVTSFCHHLEPDEDHEGLVYFNTYPFHVTTWEFIRVFKERQIQPLMFDDLRFNDLANRLKHELPWLGVLSKDSDGLCDIRDGSGRALFRDMLVPMYNIAKSIVQRLGSKYQQPIELPYV
jgi:hypothetical protein